MDTYELWNPTVHPFFMQSFIWKEPPAVGSKNVGSSFYRCPLLEMPCRSGELCPDLLVKRICQEALDSSLSFPLSTPLSVMLERICQLYIKLVSLAFIFWSFFCFVLSCNVKIVSLNNFCQYCIYNIKVYVQYSWMFSLAVYKHAHLLNNILRYIICTALVSVLNK